MSLYIPTHKELIEMGFYPQSWEGNIYRYDYKALSWHTNVDMNGSPKKEEWRLSSWYQKWYPRTKEDVERVIKLYSPND